MIEKESEILNRAGIHARPATKIVEIANKFKSNIFIEKDGNKINAKSIMGILTLGASYKSKITISIDGEDEQEAAEEIFSLFDNRFEE
ncbi:MAG: HPr family phosphocarrier protein [Spirochaetales bacterium]|nr:HPr family phosphocarrier protein [Spirochaetales bacterium]